MTNHQRKHSQSLSRMFHYKLYRSMLLSVFVLLIVLFASIGAILFRELTNYANGQIAAYATDLMTQQVNSTQNLWEQMNALSNSMQADQNITNFLMGKKKEMLVRYHAFRSLGKYKALHPFIQNISLSNQTTGERLNLLYYSQEDDIWDQDLITLGNTISVTRNVRIPGKTDQSVLTLVFPIRYYSHSITGCISIDIKIDHLQQMLDSKNAGSHTYIIGDENLLLVRPEDNYLPPLWESFISEIRHQQKETGSFYRSLDGQQHLISFCRFPSQSWTVVSIQPSSGLLAAARSQFGMLLIILVGLLAASLIIMFILMLRIYHPIDQLMSELPHEEDSMVDEVAVISNELTIYRNRSDAMTQSLHQSNIQSLLFGQPCDMVELPAAITTASCFVVGVLSPTQKHEYTIDELNQLAEEQISDLKECISFRWTDYRILVFCFDRIPSADTAGEFTQFCQACREQHNSAVRLGVSNVVDQPDMLHLAYNEALRVVSDAFYHEDQIVFTANMVKNWRNAPVTPTNTWIGRISGFLFHEQIDELNQTLEEFFAECSQLPPSFCTHVICDVLYQCIELVESTCQPKNGEALRKLFLQIEQSPTYTVLKSMSRELFSACHRLLNESEQQRSILRGQRIIHQVCEMVQKRYMHPSLSLQDAADEVSLSAGYLGRLFKQTTGQSFAEYLTTCRLKAAEKMLAETDIPVTVISKEIGMENASYFSTIFRKAYGISPSLYRETSSNRKTAEEQ